MQSDMSAVKNLKLIASARGPPKNWKCKHQQGLSIQLSVLTEFREKKVNTVSGFIAPPWGAHCVWHELSPGPGNINLLWHDHSASQETSQSLSQRVQLVSQAGSKPDRLARSAASRSVSVAVSQIISQKEGLWGTDVNQAGGFHTVSISRVGQHKKHKVINCYSYSLSSPETTKDFCSSTSFMWIVQLSCFLDDRQNNSWLCFVDGQKSGVNWSTSFKKDSNCM